MNIKKKEARNNKKKGVVEKYEKIKKALREVIIVILYLIITFPLFTAGSYYVNWRIMGDGVYSYSEDMYDEIKSVLETNITENVGIDALKIQETVKRYESNYENGETTFVCIKENGSFFKAVVTIKMASNFKIISTERNYETEKDYMNYFQIYFATVLIVGAFIAWILFTAFIYCIMFAVVRIIKSRSKKEDDVENHMTTNENPDTETEEAT